MGGLWSSPSPDALAADPAHEPLLECDPRARALSRALERGPVGGGGEGLERVVAGGDRPGPVLAHLAGGGGLELGQLAGEGRHLVEVLLLLEVLGLTLRWTLALTF